ncbi:MAG: sugar phosphate isomerase/epimerase [Verrucomicrobia bacterium]|nr:sugar phosphate isomerase/epimerase [Verrucomicrobiota bacterium]
MIPRNRIAAQLYTVRDLIRTPAEIAVTLKKIRAIGYPAVQVSGMGPIPEKELKRILDGEGLLCCATHEPPDRILEHPEEVAERLHQLDCHHVAYPSPQGVKMAEEREVCRLAQRLDQAGAILRSAGITLSYHNHAFEFYRHGHRTVLEMIFELAKPHHLAAELDTYWIQAGGGDPTAWCRSMKGRLPLLHLKDYGVKADGTTEFREIGSGNLNWPEIIEAAFLSGCEWWIIEQDQTPGDPLHSLEASRRFLIQHFSRTP